MGRVIKKLCQKYSLFRLFFSSLRFCPAWFSSCVLVGINTRSKEVANCTRAKIKYISPAMNMLRSTSRILTCRSPVYGGKRIPNISLLNLATKVSAIHRPTIYHGSVRLASSAQTPDDEQLAKAKKLMSQIEGNPKVKELVLEMQNLLTKNGVDPAKPPSKMQLIKLFSQKEARQLMFQLQAEMEAAGISQQDILLFFK